MGVPNFWTILVCGTITLDARSISRGPFQLLKAEGILGIRTRRRTLGEVARKYTGELTKPCSESPANFDLRFTVEACIVTNVRQMVRSAEHLLTRKRLVGTRYFG